MLCCIAASKRHRWYIRIINKLPGFWCIARAIIIANSGKLKYFILAMGLVNCSFSENCTMDVLGVLIS